MRLAFSCRSRCLLSEEEEYIPVLAYVEFPTQRGWRETLSVDQDGFARWLTKIQASGVNETRREKLRAFQLGCRSYHRAPPTTVGLLFSFGLRHCCLQTTLLEIAART